MSLPVYSIFKGWKNLECNITSFCLLFVLCIHFTYIIHSTIIHDSSFYFVLTPIFYNLSNFKIYPIGLFHPNLFSRLTSLQSVPIQNPFFFFKVYIPCHSRFRGCILGVDCSMNYKFLSSKSGVLALVSLYRGEW